MLASARFSGLVADVQRIQQGPGLNVRRMDTQHDPGQPMHNFIGIKIGPRFVEKPQWSHYVLLIGFIDTADDTVRG